MDQKTNFKPLGDAREHYWKMTDMAGAVGVSLVQAWDAGTLTAEDHATMVERCRGCAGVAACGRLLAHRPTLDAAPEYCVNRDAFVDMKHDE